MKRVTKLSKFQKIILMYIGMETKRWDRKYIKRTAVSIGLKDKLEIIGSNSFRVVLTNAINALYRRKLVTRMRSTVGLTELGRTVARETIAEIKKKYGTINWELIVRWYSEK